MNIPKSWNEVTTEMYQSIYPIAISDEYENELDKVIDIAMVLLNTNINNIPIKELKNLKFLLNPDSIDVKIPKTFAFKNRIYKTELDMSKIKGGQYIDLTSYTKEQDKIVANMHYLIAIMTRECNWIGMKKPYTADSMIARAEAFKKLPITISYPLCVFFCQNLENSIISIQNYLVEGVEKQMKELNHLQKSMDGL